MPVETILTGRFYGRRTEYSGSGGRGQGSGVSSLDERAGIADKDAMNRSTLVVKKIAAGLAPLAFLFMSIACEKGAKSSTTLPVAPTTTRALANPQTIPGVANFAKVSDVLYRGAQPTKEGLAELKRRGIKTVVSLRTFHSDGDNLKGTGLQYVRIPCQAWNPNDEDIARFLKVVRDPANQPVFVHCQHGADRTGCAVAVYRVLEQGWDIDSAGGELKNFGFHPIWKEIREYLQHFDAAAIRKKVQDTKMPAIKVIH